MPKLVKDDLNVLVGKLADLVSLVAQLELEADLFLSKMTVWLEVYGEYAGVENGDFLALVARREAERERKEADQMLRQAAEFGVDVLRVSRRTNGKFNCIINGAPEPFELPEKLGAFLVILGMDVPSVGLPNALVPWKTKSQIVELFLSEFGMSVNKSSIAMLASRLRGAIRERGKANKYLVQTSPTGEYRFAVKRTGLVHGESKYD